MLGEVSHFAHNEHKNVYKENITGKKGQNILSNCVIAQKMLKGRKERILCIAVFPPGSDFDSSSFVMHLKSFRIALFINPS